MEYYIEAYDRNGVPIMGNLDGQTSLLRIIDYKRTKAYKRITNLPKEKLSLNGRAVEYRVIGADSYGSETIMERIFK